MRRKEGKIGIKKVQRREGKVEERREELGGGENADSMMCVNQAILLDIIVF